MSTCLNCSLAAAAASMRGSVILCRQSGLHRHFGMKGRSTAAMVPAFYLMDAAEQKKVLLLANEPDSAANDSIPSQQNAERFMQGDCSITTRLCGSVFEPAIRVKRAPRRRGSGAIDFVSEKSLSGRYGSAVWFFGGAVACILPPAGWQERTSGKYRLTRGRWHTTIVTG